MHCNESVHTAMRGDSLGSGYSGIHAAVVDKGDVCVHSIVYVTSRQTDTLMNTYRVAHRASVRARQVMKTADEMLHNAADWLAGRAAATTTVQRSSTQGTDPTTAHAHSNLAIHNHTKAQETDRARPHLVWCKAQGQCHQEFLRQLGVQQQLPILSQ